MANINKVKKSPIYIVALIVGEGLLCSPLIANGHKIHVDIKL